MLKLPYQIAQVEPDSVPITIGPGILSILTDRDAQGRWKDGNLVRFANSSGLPQILGGWVNQTPSSGLLYNWEQLTTGLTENVILYMASSGSQIIAVDASGYVLQSTDGQTWTSAGPFTELENAVGLIWDGAQYVLVMQDGGTTKVYTSPSGATWTLAGSLSFADCNGIVYNGALYLVYSDASATYYTSPDLSTWTEQTGLSSDIANFCGVITVGADFVALCVNYTGEGLVVAASANGTSWTGNALTGTLASSGFGFIGYDSSLGYVVVDNYSDATAFSATSSFSSPTYSTTGSAYDGYCVTGTDGLFVALDVNGNSFTSVDGSTWVAQGNIGFDGYGIFYFPGYATTVYASGNPDQIATLEVSQQFTSIKGALRSAHEWESLDGQFWLALGTNCKLYLYNQATLYDITPSRRQVELSDPFTTLDGSAIVTVTDDNHGAFVGDNVQFSGASEVNGVTISGEYTVLSVTINTYTIQAATTATSSGSGGGTVSVNYDINSMALTREEELGWSANTWGTPRANISMQASIAGTTLSVTEINAPGGSLAIGMDVTGTSVESGTEITDPGSGGTGSYTVNNSQTVASEAMTGSPSGWGNPASSSAIYSQVGFWSLDNWGEDLIACPYGGEIYTWVKTTGPYAKATTLANSAELEPGTTVNAPVANGVVLVSQEAQQIISFGCSTADEDGQLTGPLDPNQIRWCNTDDYSTWVAAPTNTAGGYYLSAGSGIVGVTKTLGGYYVGCTDAAALFYATGDSNVYGVRMLGKSSRPCSPLSLADFNGTTYIMGQDNFQNYNGVLSTMSCDVYNAVYDPNLSTSINRNQMEKVTCHANRSFTEIWWNYPSIGGTGENDRYVAYNWLLNCWHYGTWANNEGGDINRSMGHDWGDVFNAPYMGYFDASSVVSPNLNGFSQLFQHETGNLANGESFFGEYIYSWDIDILNSGELTATSQLLCNMKEFVAPLDTSYLQVQLALRKYPVDEPKIKGPYQLTQSTRYVSGRGRARQLSLQIGPSYPGSSSAGLVWTMGAWRLKMGEDGDR